MGKFVYRQAVQVRLATSLTWFTGEAHASPKSAPAEGKTFSVTNSLSVCRDPALVSHHERVVGRQVARTGSFCMPGDVHRPPRPSELVK